MGASEDKLDDKVLDEVQESGNEDSDSDSASTEFEATDSVADEGALDELEQARQDAGEARDQALRAVAEMENVRRRSEQEIGKARKFAVEAFATELLQVKDSLDLAANVSLDDSQDDVVKGMAEGLSLTLKQLDGVFEKFGIQTVSPAAGDKLNPELHQAMVLQPSTDVEPNHILNVVQKGYTLNDRLLRAAMVIVAKVP
ncbi:MAG: molecular chaperone GrpE [Parasphingorhabdus sp.]|jgi:molecular chaperone GrpE